MYVIDEAAAELVCDGPVCVTKTHQARLSDLAGPGKKALRLLHDALGSQAPVSVRENTAVLPEGSTPRWSRETVLFDWTMPLPAQVGHGSDIVASTCWRTR